MISFLASNGIAKDMMRFLRTVVAFGSIRGSEGIDEWNIGTGSTAS
jgi:hypothetical protein